MTSNIRSWINTVLLAIILCAIGWFLYPRSIPVTTQPPTTFETTTTIQFNVPMSEVHEYEQENE